MSFLFIREGGSMSPVSLITQCHKVKNQPVMIVEMMEKWRMGAIFIQETKVPQEKHLMICIITDMITRLQRWLTELKVIFIQRIPRAEEERGALTQHVEPLYFAKTFRIVFPWALYADNSVCWQVFCDGYAYLWSPGQTLCVQGSVSSSVLQYLCAQIHSCSHIKGETTNSATGTDLIGKVIIHFW